ncbi:hypothetical protein ACNKHU_12310 [Shigella flexneri]
MRRSGEKAWKRHWQRQVHDRFQLTNEASDLMYHLLVLLQGSGFGLN